MIKRGVAIGFMWLLSITCILAQKGENTHLGTMELVGSADTAKINAAIKAGRAMTDSTAAKNLLFTCLNESLQISYIPGVKGSLLTLMQLMDQRGAYQEKEAILKSVLNKVLKQTNLYATLPFIYNAMARDCIINERYEMASHYYQEAIHYAQLLDTSFLAVLYNNYGSMLSTGNSSTGSDVKQALIYINKAESIAIATHDSNMLAYIALNKGEAYGYMQDYEKGLEEFQRGLDIAEKRNLSDIKLVALRNIANNYHRQGKPEQGLFFLEKAYALMDKDVDVFIRNALILTLGKLYFELKQYAKAEQLLKGALKNAERYHIARDIIEGNLRLAELFAAKGQYPQAYDHLYRFLQTNDSIRAKEIINNINAAEVKYRALEKEKDVLEKQLNIDRQQKQIDRKNAYIIAGILAAAILTLVFLVVYIRLREKQKLLKRDTQIREMKALINGEEKERIRLAQELHDGIGGMLAAINMNMNVAKRTGFNDKEELTGIMQMIEETTEEVRRTSHNLMPSALLRHNLKDALIHYRNYINQNDSLIIDLHVHGDMETIGGSYTVVIFRIVQELIQNVIKHAHATHAIVELEKLKNKIQLIVEDNGIGFDISKRKAGIGLENLQSRVNSLGGKIRIDSQKDIGTSISIEFDIQ